MFTSHAHWPKDAGFSSNDNESSDEHETLEQARAVCRFLREKGFGGDGETFPDRVWITDNDTGLECALTTVDEAVARSENCYVIRPQPACHEACLLLRQKKQAHFPNYGRGRR